MYQKIPQAAQAPQPFIEPTQDSSIGLLTFSTQSSIQRVQQNSWNYSDDENSLISEDTHHHGLQTQQDIQCPDETPSIGMRKIKSTYYGNQTIACNFLNDQNGLPQEEKYPIDQLEAEEVTDQVGMGFLEELTINYQTFMQINSNLNAPAAQEDQNSLTHIINHPSQNPIKETKKEPTIINEVPQQAPQKKKPNYEKNICSYVTKKVVRCFLSKNYSKFVRKLCQKEGCRYEEAIQYYSKQFRQVFGIGNLSLLITAQDENQIAMKRMFCAFFNWFLRQKYMLYVLSDGKMQHKEKYIDFKNKYLLNIAQISDAYNHMF